MKKFYKLHDMLKLAGWNVANVDTPSHYWWALEIWKLESTWSPTGSIAYISFFLDPQSTDASKRANSGDIWAIDTGRTFPPESIMPTAQTVYLTGGFQESLQKVIIAANIIRDNSSQA